MAKNLSEMTLEELWTLFPIILKEHQKEYSQWYTEAAAHLTTVIGHSVIYRMQHIGSTAIPGLTAKPIIDILLELNTNYDIDIARKALEADDWILMSMQNTPDLKLAFNKGYTPDGFTEKVYHLHVRYAGDWSELYFRDYLLTHPEACEAYARLKLDLIHTYRNDRDGYTNAKGDLILKYTELARREFPDRYKP